MGGGRWAREALLLVCNTIPPPQKKQSSVIWDDPSDCYYNFARSLQKPDDINHRVSQIFNLIFVISIPIFFSAIVEALLTSVAKRRNFLRARSLDFTF